nr:unnamed protein product [Spirometra erinaceieuropaei]
MQNVIAEATCSGRRSDAGIFTTLIAPALFVAAGRNDDSFGQKRIALDDVFGLIKYGSPGIAEKFIKNNPEVAGIRHNFRGCTALHYAVLVDDQELVKILLAAGANPTLKNARGHTPEMYSKNSTISQLLDGAKRQFVIKEQAREREERQRYPLEERLREKLVGQEQAIRTVASGNKFESDIFQTFLTFLGCAPIRTTAYHPAANGMVEPFHRQIKAALRASEDRKNWSNNLPLALLVIRASLMSDLDCGAAELIFGTILRLPGEMVIPTSCTADESRPPTPNPASPTAPAPNPTASTTTTALTANIRHPCVPPPSVTATSIVPAITTAATTITMSLTTTTGQNVPGGPSTPTLATPTYSDVDSTPASPH